MRCVVLVIVLATGRSAWGSGSVDGGAPDAAQPAAGPTPIGKVSDREAMACGGPQLMRYPYEKIEWENCIREYRDAPRKRRLQAEAEARAAEQAAAERAAREAAEEARANDPAVQRAAWSASLCRAQVTKRQFLGQIADAKRAAKIGGVLNTAAVRQASEIVVMAEKQEKRARDALKQLRAKPHACNDGALANYDTCSDSSETCPPDDLE